MKKGMWQQHRVLGGKWERNKDCGMMFFVTHANTDLRITTKEQCWEELRLHLRRDGMRWEEIRWRDMRWEEIRWSEMRWTVECEAQVCFVKCRACSVQCEVWRKCSLDVAWHRGRTQVTFLDNNSRTSAEQVRTKHGARRTAHGACKFYRWKNGI